LVKVLGGKVPEHCVERREAGTLLVLACETPVHGPMTVEPLVETELPRLVTRGKHVGAEVIGAFAPWGLKLDPLVTAEHEDDLGVAVDIGTTTLQLLLVDLRRGVVVGEASRYNPQIPRRYQGGRMLFLE
jgi:uncharacterized 2Fe-2S/4Fe-4S cluster protein (DUF4445 family)